jgi:hypothetical protein
LEHQAAGRLGPIEQAAVDAGGEGLQQLGFAAASFLNAGAIAAIAHAAG